MIDDAHFAHGLAGDEQPPDWPRLSHVEAGAVLGGFPGLGACRALVWHSPRPLSAAARVETAMGSVFVKRHHASVRSAATLTEEHRFAAYLRGQGVPVPRILANREGKTAVDLGDWVYEVHELATGADRYQDACSWTPVDGRAQALSAGHMLGRLQQAAAGYVAPQRDTHILVARADILSAADPVAEIRRQLGGRPALARYLAGRQWEHDLQAAIAPWQPRVAQGVAGLPTRWTHGDWHVSNLCWQGAGEHATVTDVLDFGLSAQTFALFDLATAIERNAIAWLETGTRNIGRPELARALIEGYASVLPLDSAALHLLADILPVVHVDFALSEIEYFEGITRRHDHADVAWESFLLGHARWFMAPEGEALLEAIRHTG